MIQKLIFLISLTLILTSNPTQSSSEGIFDFLFKKQQRKELIDQSKTGDLIFIKSTSSQSDVIEAVTKSSKTHVGMIVKEAGKTYVYEAINVVSITPIDQFLKRAKNGKFEIKRVNHPLVDLNDPKVVTKLLLKAKKYKGKRYDIYFEWGQDLIYCSELVWLIYHDTFSTEKVSFELSKKEKWSVFKSKIENDPEASRLMRSRYAGRGGHPNWNGDVVTPVAVFDSALLQNIKAKRKSFIKRLFF